MVITDKYLPDEQAAGWLQALSWIAFFRAVDAGENVWMKVVTRSDAASEEVEEVYLCGSPDGFFIDPLDEVGGGWLHLMMGRSYPDLRKVLSCKSQFLDRTAEELGLGLK